MFAIPLILLLIGTAMHWLAYSRVLHRQAEIKQLSAEYASSLFRNNIFNALISGGHLRVSTLLFTSPPHSLVDLMRPMRKSMAIAYLVSLSGLALFFLKW